MRLFAILLLLLFAGFGWALWQGIDLASGWLVETTAEERETLVVLDGVERTAGEQGSDTLETALEPASEEIWVAPDLAPDPAAEAPAEIAATPAAASEEPTTPSAEAAPEALTGTAEAPAPDAVLEPAAAAPDTRRVTGDRVNLRQGPDAGTDSLGLLSLDDAVEVLEVGGDWLRVRTEDGEEGWVAARFLARSQG